MLRSTTSSSVPEPGTRLLIGGELVPGEGAWLDVENPYSEETIATIALPSPSQVSIAIAAAADAARPWAATPALERAEMLHDERTDLIPRQAPHPGADARHGQRLELFLLGQAVQRAQRVVDVLEVGLTGATCPALAWRPVLSQERDDPLTVGSGPEPSLAGLGMHGVTVVAKILRQRGPSLA